MSEADSSKTTKTDDVEVLSASAVPNTALPLVVVEQPLGSPSREIELARLRHEQEVAMVQLRQEGEERAHERKREMVDRVAGHILRSMIVIGGVALFPLHYPMVGGLLLGAGLDLLTKTELRKILRGAIQGYRGNRK